MGYFSEAGLRADQKNVMDATPNFEPNQIVCLELEHRYLYAEIIQVIPSRQMLWVRPLILKQDRGDESLCWNLQDGADLVWPVQLFRMALDTEVIPLLAELGAPAPEKSDKTLAHQQLRAFMDQVWQTQCAHEP